MKHRILALFIAFCLFLCVLPSSYAAGYTPDQQLNILQNVADRIHNHGLYSTEEDDPLADALLTQLAADPALFDRLMSAMLDGYDAYSGYIPAGTYSTVYDSESSYVGIGVTIQAHPKGALVTDVNLQGSAALAGIKMGDILTHAAGKSLKGLDVSAISELLRGKVDTTVKVTVLRGSENLTFELQRTAITQLNFSGAPVADGVFYMKWSRIRDDGSYMMFRMMLAQMVREGYEALILDLRDNPGGSLDLAFNITSDFISEPGPFFRTEIRDPMGREELSGRFIHAEGDGVSIPHLYVLINGESASAAEIITAGLRDGANATVIGETTYGKARGQQHLVLTNDAGVVFTTTRLLTLAGEDYEGVGIAPHIEVHNQILYGDDAIVVPTAVALAPYSCSDNGLLLNQALVALGLLEQLPEKPYRLGDETLDALNRLQASHQLQDSTPGAGIPTLMLVNRLLDAQLQGRYVQDTQLDTAIQLAREALKTE